MNKANINRQLNCAIYTRKSTDEGLDKEFNSLKVPKVEVDGIKDPKLKPPKKEIFANQCRR